MNHTRQFIRKTAVIGMLLAVQVVAGLYISIRLPIATIGFTFLPLSITAMLYGPLWGSAAAFLGDFLIAALGPYGYFPPMATTALLSGFLYGVFLYRKPITTKRVLLCVLVESLLCSVLLQTYWITLLSGKGYLALMPVRLFQNLITAPVSVICIRMAAGPVLKLAKQYGIVEAPAVSKA